MALRQSYEALWIHVFDAICIRTDCFKAGQSARERLFMSWLHCFAPFLSLYARQKDHWKPTAGLVTVSEKNQLTLRRKILSFRLIVIQLTFLCFSVMISRLTWWGSHPFREIWPSFWISSLWRFWTIMLNSIQFHLVWINFYSLAREPTNRSLIIFLRKNCRSDLQILWKKSTCYQQHYCKCRQFKTCR